MWFCEWSKTEIKFHSFACEFLVSQHFIEIEYPFPFEFSWLFCQVLVDGKCVGFFSELSVLVCGSMCLFLCQYHAVLNTTALCFCSWDHSKSVTWLWACLAKTALLGLEQYQVFMISTWYTRLLQKQFYYSFSPFSNVMLMPHCLDYSIFISFEIKH